MSNKTPPRPKTIRCAIYTRKSTEEGLDQQFNSLVSEHDSPADLLGGRVAMSPEIC